MRGLRIFETRRARALRKDAPKAERILWSIVERSGTGSR